MSDCGRLQVVFQMTTFSVRHYFAKCAMVLPLCTLGLRFRGDDGGAGCGSGSVHDQPKGIQVRPGTQPSGNAVIGCFKV